MSRGWEYAWKLYADEVIHSKTRRCKLHIWWFLGGDWVEMHIHTIFPWLGFITGFLCTFWCTHAFINAHTHNLPLTGIYKGIFVHVLVYACFYKSENICAYANLAFVHTYTFRMKSTESLIHEGTRRCKCPPKRIRDRYKSDRSNHFRRWSGLHSRRNWTSVNASGCWNHKC